MALKKIDEVQISKALIKEFMNDLLNYTECDVVIVGAGPAGMTAARYSAKWGAKTLLLERNNFAGGGLWTGGYLFPKFLVETPAHKIVEEVGVRLKSVDAGLYAADSAEVASKCMASALDAGAKFLNNTVVEDVIYRREAGERIEGVVINWYPTTLLPPNITCYDPIGIKAKMVVDATGHDAVVAKIAAQKLSGLKMASGIGAMNVPEAEELIVENTREVFPGLIVAGMSVSAVYKTPRMGPIYGGMLLSGKKAAELALEKIGLKVAAT